MGALKPVAAREYVEMLQDTTLTIYGLAQPASQSIEPVTPRLDLNPKSDSRFRIKVT